MTEDSRHRKIFVTGGTGYIGRRMIQALISRGHEIRALARPDSVSKLPPGCVPVIGNALEGISYMDQVRPADTFVHLVGVANPGPLKAEQFRTVDLASVRASLPSARSAAVGHFVYVSVAQPAPIMKAYIRARKECEGLIRASGLNATILRPWYVLGPGHWWPYALAPFYWLFERLPPTRDTAQRLGLVRLPEMIRALIWAIENPVQGIRIVEVKEIRAAGGEAVSRITS
jgi:uncharacterized protein YbjT (DUF2867 family)